MHTDIQDAKLMFFFRFRKKKLTRDEKIKKDARAVRPYKVIGGYSDYLKRRLPWSAGPAAASTVAFLASERLRIA